MKIPKPMLTPSSQRIIAMAALSVFAAEASASVTATIQVDATTLIRSSIPATIFGSNLEWPANAEGSFPSASLTTNNSWFFSPPRSTQPPFNSSTYTAANLFGLGTIRFPGGAYADYYNWRDGVNDGVSDQKVLNSVNLPVLKAWRTSGLPDGIDTGTSPDVVGTDDIVALTQSVGGLPMFQVAIRAPYAMASGETIQHVAADWVSYCNVASDSRRLTNIPSSTSGYGIKYWEIGNEPYYSGHGLSAMTPGGYLSTLNTFATSMRTVDPSIQIIATGDPDNQTGGTTLQWDTSTTYSSTGTWNQQLGNALHTAVAANTQHPFDLVAIHDSYAPVFVQSVSTGSLSDNDVYQAMWAFPLQMSTNQQNLEKILASAEGVSGTPQTKLAVTEWGPLFAQAAGSLNWGYQWFDYTKTLGSAVFTASGLEALIRDPGVQIANFFTFSSIGQMGLYSDPAAVAVTASNPANDAETVSGYVFQLFHQHFGTQLITTTTPTNPTYDVPVDIQPYVWHMANYTAIPRLDVVSSLNAAGTVMDIIVVNKSLKSDPAITANITLNGFSPASTGTAYVINSGTLNDNNGNNIDPVSGISGLPLAPTGSNTQHVAIASSSVTGVSAAGFQYTFQPGSVTAIELTKQ